MTIVLADLHEDRARFDEKITSDGEAISEIGEIAMDAVPPSVAECLDLFRLAGDVVAPSVFHVAAGGGPLEVAVKLDAIRRVDVDALDFPAQAFTLGEA